MICEVEGDILFFGVQVIVYGIVFQDYFDSGLVFVLCECWLLMVCDYWYVVYVRVFELGGIWVWVGVDEQGKIQCIVNLIIQGMLYSGCSVKLGKVSLEDVGYVLCELVCYVCSEGVSSLVLFCVVMGVGGLDWFEVKLLVVCYLGDLEILVIFYEVYCKGVVVEEKLV